MADKKITQLPSLSFISGSLTGYSAGEVVLPIVHNNTTVKIEAQKFALYATQWSATTASNTFIGNQTINGNITATGDVVVQGKLTAQEVHTEITSASIIFESGSTIFGNSADDTHQFTGTINLNGKVLGNAPLDFTSQSLNTQTGSQESINTTISFVTGSIDKHILAESKQTGSQDLVNFRNSTVTSSLNSATASLNQATSSLNFASGALNVATGSYNKFYGVTSSVHFTTQSLNTQTGSQELINVQNSIVSSSLNIATASLNFTTGALNLFTGSILGQTNTIATFTSSVNFATQSLNTQTGSQDSVNLRISSTTGSINTTTSSFNSVFLGISSVTGAMNTQSSSQNSINYQNSIVTSSFRAEIGGIEAYTASLKNAIVVNGTNVQIVGELDVARLNVQYVSSSVAYSSGSNVFGDASNDKHEFTGSVNIADTLFIKGQAIGTGELNAFTGSQIGKDFTLSKVTASIDAHILKQATQTGSQDVVNFNLSKVTASIDAHILGISIQTSSIGSVFTGLSNVTGAYSTTFNSIDAHILKQATQTGSQDLVNNQNSIVTSSFRAEIGGIEAYTASLKASAIVSSSTQIQNYNVFALTASANTFWGTQTFSGSFNVSGSTVQTGNNTLVGNTVLSGSIEVSGSSNFHNSLFIVSGSSFFTGSHYVTGNSVFSGSINIASGSSYYRAGNKLFNYGQWASLETQSGSADTAYPIKLGTTMGNIEGFSIANNGSGFPTRITATNTGLYNIQFSLQLNTTATETCDFSVWFAMTGSAIANSNTDFSINKTAGGGNGLAALNLLTQITAGDYIELYWSKTTANGQLQYKASQSTPTRPATPSAIVTVTQHA